MNEAAVAIRHRRAEAGISRREMARRVQTSPATLAKYERGEVCPGTDTLERILGGALRQRRRWQSLGALAAAMVEEFERDRPDLAFRWCLEVLDDEHAADAETALFVSRRPEITGDSRVDAMMAALAEYICVQRKIPTPLWLCEPRVCRPFWFVSDLPAFQALAIRESPPCFTARGIFVTRRGLMRA